MKPILRVLISLAVSPLFSVASPNSLAADPTHEKLLQPTRLTLITTGSDLATVIAEIEKQTGNKLEDQTRRPNDAGELPAWNFSMSDRDFWPLLDRFLDAAELEPINIFTSEALPIGRRPSGMTPRYGKAIYVGPFRLEVTEVTSRLGMRVLGDHRANITLEVAWEPRLKPLLFTQSAGSLQMIADEKTPVTVEEGPRELSVEVGRDDHAAELHIPLELPLQQLESISSLKGRIKALVSARTAEFRFDNLPRTEKVEKSDGGLTVALNAVRENQGLFELHMRMEFAAGLPRHIAQGSWNFQNTTYLENGAGERIEHVGFETTSQGERQLGLAYYFDVPAGKLSEYKWVYHAPVAIVEVPIEFEVNHIPLP